MNRTHILEALKGGLIVSCQAYAGEALFGADMMARIALAAKEGGAVGIRANSPPDIAAVKAAVGMPVIGIWKEHYADSPVYITPTLREAIAIADAGADIIAIDATDRLRPGGVELTHMIAHLKSNYACLLMADVSTPDEGARAESLGFDIVSTTLAGYTAHSPELDGPDLELISQLARRLSVPVFAEGRVHTPDQARQCLQRGAYAVVVGSAITRPELITRRFVDGIRHEGGAHPSHKSQKSHKSKSGVG